MTVVPTTRGRLRRALAVASVAWMALASAPRAGAQSVVTLCAQDDQGGLGVNLNAALAAGGPVSFHCPAGSVIRITSPKLISGAVSVNGLQGSRGIRLANAIPAQPPALPFMLQVMPGGRLDIADVEFGAGDSTGGAILSQGDLRVVGSRFDNLYLGISVPRGVAAVINSRFENNNIAVGFDLTAARLRVIGGRFTANSRGVAGAAGLAVLGIPGSRSFVVERSFFADNLIAVQHCSNNDCPVPFELEIANSLIVASRDGQAAVFGRAIRLVNTTVAANRGIGIDAQAGGAVTLVNSIVAGNTGGNCRGQIVTGGSNLQFPDGTCGASTVQADPGLSTMWEPARGGPAHGTADAAVCAGAPVNRIDFYAKARLASARCSIGAVEQPLEHPPVLPSPLDRERGRLGRRPGVR